MSTAISAASKMGTPTHEPIEDKKHAASEISPDDELILKQFFSHCDTSKGEAGAVKPQINEDGDVPEFEYAEHRHLGDSLTLQGKVREAAHYYFVLPKSGTRVTYGEINGLAGDFFGTKEPICDGTTADDCRKRFRAAYNTLTQLSTSDNHVNKILETLQYEVENLNPNIPRSISEKYKAAWDATLQIKTLFRPFPNYFDLAALNLDHFGKDARTAYNSGHYLALLTAKSGNRANGAHDPTVLDEAYSLNAFADHFLQDSFSAGHLRTPRRKLFGMGTFDVFKNLLAKCMHDEDNSLGLKVSNPDRSKTWTAYGDKKLVCAENAVNKEQCLSALKESVDEIYLAWSTGYVTPESEYKAWSHAPDLDLLASEETNFPAASRNHAPLFNSSGDVRRDLRDLKCWIWEPVQVPAAQLARLKAAGF